METADLRRAVLVFQSRCDDAGFRVRAGRIDKPRQRARPHQGVGIEQDIEIRIKGADADIVAA